MTKFIFKRLLLCVIVAHSLLGVDCYSAELKAVDSIKLDNLPTGDNSSPRVTNKYLAQFRDKSGSLFSIEMNTHLDEGVYTHLFYVADTSENLIDKIYENISNPEAGGCSSSNKKTLLDVQEIPKQDLAYLNYIVTKGDASGDGYSDLVIVIREQNCDTKESHYRGFLITPKDKNYSIVNF